MRMFIVNLLAAALLAFSASSAGAISLALAGADGQTVNPGEQFSVTVTLDTEATTGITLMSIGVLFDDTKVAYVKEATETTTTSYILYGGKGGGGYMKANTTCGGYPVVPPGSAGCTIRVGTTNQVNVDYVSVDLTGGTQNTGVVQLVTLAFDVLAGASGNADFSLTQLSPGNVIGQPGGESTTATLTPDGDNGQADFVVVPEPGVAGLSLAALLTVGGLRIRSRQRR